MKTPKERLYRVLVLGATPAGIAATNKLGELGIPVTLVDPDTDLNEKLAREEWRLGSGMTLNYALRPGLLRILRNGNIRTVIPGGVGSLKHSTQGFPAGASHHRQTPATLVSGQLSAGRQCPGLHCAQPPGPIRRGAGSSPARQHSARNLWTDLHASL
jgi:heterodisulfide reductase subunit A-like polyferredoxin